MVRINGIRIGVRSQEGRRNQEETRTEESFDRQLKQFISGLTQLKLCIRLLGRGWVQRKAEGRKQEAEGKKRLKGIKFFYH
ncbi:MAG: hypothetical protein F6K39_41515 [Okeania sp. SIO3B3]|nr:hypothetical protein [Okeania sp. SIO3B3]